MEELRIEEMKEVTENAVEVAQEVAEQAAKAGMGTGTKLAIGFAAVTVVTCTVIGIYKGVQKKKAKKAEEAAGAETVDESNFEETAE